MTDYELWLDESGQFNNDKEVLKKGWRPSLIGGILFKKKDFSENLAEHVKGENYNHSNESNVNEVFDRFAELVNKNVKFIDISNDELVYIIDSNLTYQNMMAQGIIQIISKLKEQNKDGVKLHILIAERGDCTSDNKNKRKVTVEQYRSRIEERILLEGYKKNIDTESWEIEVQDAKKDTRLIMADIVCNAFLTRDTKFKDEKRKFINEVHDDEDKTWTFSVFEDSFESQIKRYIIDQKIADAVFYLCQNNDEELISRKMKDIGNYLQSASGNEINLHVKDISSKLMYIIDVRREYEKCLNLLDNLLKHWLPVLKDNSRENDYLYNIAKLDYLFYKDTIYTHMGDVEGSLCCERQCDELISTMSLTWEHVAYKMKYANRKIVTRINMFDFEGALEAAGNLVNACEGVKEALQLADENSEEGHFDELAKTFGTEAQLHMFRIREDRQHYCQAIECSDKAIREFEDEKDRRKQYSYRVQIETEGKEFDKALEYLYRQNGLDVNKSELKDVVTEVVKYEFGLSAYIRLMAEGRLAGWQKADEMYDELNKTECIKKVRENSGKYHPFEIIMWKYATYQMERNNVNAAMEYYKDSVHACFDTNNFTVRIIGLAILFEKYAYAIKYDIKDKRPHLKELKKYYKEVIESTIKCSILEAYADVDFEVRDWEYYFKLSRQITY